MQTPTLTEARRALLEISQPEHAAYLTEQIALRLTVVAAYLDAQVALNVENFGDWSHRKLIATQMSPTMSDIVASADGKSADGMTLHFRTKEKYEAAALAMQDVRSRDLDGLKDYKPLVWNQPGVNDIVTRCIKYTGADVVTVDLGLTIIDSVHRGTGVIPSNTKGDNDD